MEANERLGVSGILVRRMVKDHVGNRLTELSAAFGQLAPAVRPGDPSWKWLDAAHDDCERIIETLSKSRLRPLALLSLVVSPAVAVTSKLSGLPGWVGDALLIAAVVAIPAILALYAGAWASYRCKRELLLLGASEIDRQSVPCQKKATGPNVYVAENRAFAAVGRTKRLEVEIDGLLRNLAWSVVLELGVILFFSFRDDGSHQTLWMAGLVVCLIGFAGLLIQSSSKFDRTRYWI